MRRRRFLAIAAAFAAAPRAAPARTWSGRALGAEVRITLRGPRDIVEPAIAELGALLDRFGRLYSLHDPGSVLSRLNARGRTGRAPAEFAALLDLADRVHHATGGLFDPTVQARWEALSRGRDASAAPVGWAQVRRNGRRVALGPGQKLTLNGIAQGAATDAVTDALARRGLTDLLVHVGEFRGLGGPWRIGVADPGEGLLLARRLTDGAIATSSPRALLVGGRPHILDPRGARPPPWSTVSVEAATAALADAASTAFALARPGQIRAALPALPGITRVTALAPGGRLVTFAPGAGAGPSSYD